MKQQRKSRQRQLILDTVMTRCDHPTADQIYLDVRARDDKISRGTVYRNLQRLCETGEIRKREIPGEADRYDHLCHDHYHARCVKCGRVFDVDMEYMTGLEKSIRDAHGFVFTGHDIVFQGICADCQKEPDNT